MESKKRYTFNQITPQRFFTLRPYLFRTGFWGANYFLILKTNKTMTTQHTKGQWNYKTEGFKISIGNEKTGNTTTAHDYKVCEIDDNSMQAEANAKLIAASPIMIDALIQAKKTLEMARKYMPKSIKNSDKFDFENAVAIIGSAIHKATK